MLFLLHRYDSFAVFVRAIQDGSLSLDRMAISLPHMRDARAGSVVPRFFPSLLHEQRALERENTSLREHAAELQAQFRQMAQDKEACQAALESVQEQLRLSALAQYGFHHTCIPAMHRLCVFTIACVACRRENQV